MFNIFKKKVPTTYDASPKPDSTLRFHRSEQDKDAMREHVATAILAAIVSRYGSDDKYIIPNARRAVKHADALIKELKKPQP